jgi:hypothetical protein
MAEPRHNPSNPGDAAEKLGPGKARQGQNVRGMIWVLIVGIALVVLAYTVMLALSAQPVAPDNHTIAPAPIAATPTQETAQSPNSAAVSPLPRKQLRVTFG